jgi:hypothetical protein
MSLGPQLHGLQLAMGGCDSKFHEFRSPHRIFDILVYPFQPPRYSTRMPFQPRWPQRVLLIPSNTRKQNQIKSQHTNTKKKQNLEKDRHLIFRGHLSQSRERSPRAISWSSRPFFYPLVSLFCPRWKHDEKAFCCSVCVLVVDPPPAPVGGTGRLRLPIDGEPGAGQQSRRDPRAKQRRRRRRQKG